MQRSVFKVLCCVCTIQNNCGPILKMVFNSLFAFMLLIPPQTKDFDLTCYFKDYHFSILLHNLLATKITTIVNMLYVFVFPFSLSDCPLMGLKY